MLLENIKFWLSPGPGISRAQKGSETGASPRWIPPYPNMFGLVNSPMKVANRWCKKLEVFFYCATTESFQFFSISSYQLPRQNQMPTGNWTVCSAKLSAYGSVNQSIHGSMVHFHPCFIHCSSICHPFFMAMSNYQSHCSMSSMFIHCSSIFHGYLTHD